MKALGLVADSLNTTYGGRDSVLRSSAPSGIASEISCSLGYIKMAVSGAVFDNTSFKHFLDELTFSRSKFLVFSVVIRGTQLT